jgi:hypothetical protein
LELSAHGSLLAMLEALDLALPPVLVPVAARQRLRELSATLPFISCIGLECHLGATSPRVDLLAYTAEQAVLRALLDGTPLGRAHGTDGPSRALLDRWVNAILFEFDLDDSTRARPPAVFLNLQPDAIIDGPSLVQLAACVAGELSCDAARWIRQCAAAAGRDSQITHVGAMASRGNRPLRINVGAVSAGALSEFVAVMDWPPDRRAAVDTMLRLAEPFVHHAVLAFDFARLPLPRIGLECYMASSAEDGNNWRVFLTHLTEAGLCSPAEAAGLLEWPGRTVDAEHRVWPPAHRRLASFLGARHPGAISRTLNHVKLVSGPGAPLYPSAQKTRAGGPAVQAKAYLLARHVWLDLMP